MTAFNQLGEYGLNQILARRLVTPGPAPSPTVEPAMFPALVLENDRAEWSFLSGERRVSVGVFVGANAGTFSSVQLHNPTGSNTLVTVERVLGSNTTQQVLAYLERTGVIGIVTAIDRSNDGRWPNQRPTAQCFTDIGAVALPAGLPNWRFPPASLVDVALPFILRPGDTLRIVPAVNNSSCTASFLWRERAALPGEL